MTLSIRSAAHAPAPKAANPKAPAKPAAKPAPKAAPATPAASPNGSQGASTGGSDVIVDILNSDSGYENKIYWSSDNFATRHYIGIDNQTQSIKLGSFAEGTKIEFGIVNGMNQFYRTGSASTNSDNFQHATAETTADGTKIGFEDLAGGGDRDFNDVMLRVRTTPAAPQPEATTATVSPPAPATAGKAAGTAEPKNEQQGDDKSADKNTNRSGLGDGTNPGQGAGRDNATNTGTNNPNNATGAKAVEATAKKVAQAYGAASPVQTAVTAKKASASKASAAKKK